MTLKHDYPLAEILWYKVGGTAKYYIEAENKKDILDALDFIKEQKPQCIFVCGLGSNLIFSDDYFDGLVIRIVTDEETDSLHRIGDDIIEVFGGVVLDDLITFTFENNLVGLEWAGGLPGTIGAGVRGNVGAFGGEIKDSFISAEVLEMREDGYDVYTIRKDDFHFSYRNSIIKEKKNLIVISAKFQLKKAKTEELERAKAIYAKNSNYRKTNHPIEYPTCGSVFKNIHDRDAVANIISQWPETKELVEEKWHGKFSMGYIIKRLGLVGYRVGNMEISSKHANFIINLGHAKASDAKGVITEIQRRVHDAFGFTPEVEVEIVA